MRDPDAGEMQHDQRKKVGSDLHVSRPLCCQFAARLGLSRRDSAAAAAANNFFFLKLNNLFSLFRFR